MVALREVASGLITHIECESRGMSCDKLNLHWAETTHMLMASNWNKTRLLHQWENNHINAPLIELGLAVPAALHGSEG